MSPDAAAVLMWVLGIEPNPEEALSLEGTILTASGQLSIGGAHRARELIRKRLERYRDANPIAPEEWTASLPRLGGFARIDLLDRLDRKNLIRRLLRHLAPLAIFPRPADLEEIGKICGALERVLGSQPEGEYEEIMSASWNQLL